MKEIVLYKKLIIVLVGVLWVLSVDCDCVRSFGFYYLNYVVVIFYLGLVRYFFLCFEIICKFGVKILFCVKFELLNIFVIIDMKYMCN